MRINLVITGGTIDGIDGQALPGHKSIIANYIQSINPYFQIIENVVCLKDSRFVTDDDRKNILQTITTSSDNLFLVTHGTFTMSETAEYLLQYKNMLENKTIIFVGSFVLGLINSDGPFNLGFAIKALIDEKPGIYIAMNGHVFAAGTTYKDETQNKFILKP
jgi:L-asparaginase